MRRTGLLISGWALATLLALVLGLQGVSAISDSVTSHPKPSLSPASVKAALNRSSASSNDEVVSSSASDSPSSASGGQSSPQGGASNLSASSDASSGSDTEAEHSGPPGSNQPPEDHFSSSEDGHGDESSSSQSFPPAQDRSYQLVGGSVGVRFENGEAHLLWATPNAGFSVDPHGDASSVDVRFASDAHESRLEAYWDHGPQQKIEENPS